MSIRHATLQFVLINLCTWSLVFIIFDRCNEINRLEEHIEYLEEYIQENHLPTPAMRIN